MPGGRETGKKLRLTGARKAKSKKAETPAAAAAAAATDSEATVDGDTLQEEESAPAKKPTRGRNGASPAKAYKGKSKAPAKRPVSEDVEQNISCHL